MKKLLSIIVLGFLFSGSAYASILEFGNCYGKYGPGLWNDEEYDKAKFHYYKYFENPKFKNNRWRIRDFITGYDFYNDLELEEQNEVEENYNKFLIFEKYIVSINTSASTVTVLKEISQESLNQSSDYRRTLGNLIKEKGGSDFEKKWVEDWIPPKKTSINKFFIADYVGGIIVAYDEQENRAIKIDLNTLRINYGYKDSIYDTPFISWVCNENLGDDVVGGDENNSSSSGTAFFVSNSGHLLTNNHVVEGCTLSKISYKNNDYDTKLIATDKTLDLALLKADLKNKSYIDFASDEAKKMQKIYVGGYPLGKGLSDDLKISSGIVSSLKGFQDNSNEIQIDAAINPGNSGGPIINEDGELVAIAVSGLAKDQTEGINFGIKSSAAERFLKSNKLKANKSIFSSSKKNDQLLKILEEATVYTYCN
jgi:S1-C subfamily serine protease